MFFSHLLRRLKKGLFLNMKVRKDNIYKARFDFRNRLTDDSVLTYFRNAIPGDLWFPRQWKQLINFRNKIHALGPFGNF